VAAAIAIAAAAIACGAASSAPTAVGGQILYVLQRTDGAKGAWLEISNLRGGDRHALTPEPSARTHRYDQVATFSPDGKRVAFIRVGQSAGNALYVVNADGTGLTRVAGPKQVGRGIDQVEWSPSGDELVFIREAGQDLPVVGEYTCNVRPTDVGVYVVRPDGSGLTSLPVVPRSWLPSSQHPLKIAARGWTDGGRRVLVAMSRWDHGECSTAAANVDSERLYSIGADGAGRRVVLVRHRAHGTFTFVGQTEISPDGRLAYSIDGGDCNLRLVTPSGTVPVATGALEGCEHGSGLSFLWLPSGKSIVFADGLHVGRVDLPSGALYTLQTRRNVPSICRKPGNAAVCQDMIVGVSSDGRELALVDFPGVPYVPGRIWVVPTSGGPAVSLGRPQTGRKGAVVRGFAVRLD
jgi:hypothetical protein